MKAHIERFILTLLLIALGLRLAWFCPTEWIGMIAGCIIVAGVSVIFLGGIWIMTE
jgi:hypothetical protein